MEKGIMNDWAKKNIGVVIMGVGVPLLMFANSAWMDAKIAVQLTSFVPVTVWQTWVRERSEWRSVIEGDVSRLRDVQERDRRDIDSKLHSLELKIDRALVILEKTEAPKRP
jgi:hypothetical protein